MHLQATPRVVANTRLQLPAARAGVANTRLQLPAARAGVANTGWWLGQFLKTDCHLPKSFETAAHQHVQIQSEPAFSGRAVTRIRTHRASSRVQPVHLRGQ